MEMFKNISHERTTIIMNTVSLKFKPSQLTQAIWRKVPAWSIHRTEFGWILYASNIVNKMKYLINLLKKKKPSNILRWLELILDEVISNRHCRHCCGMRVQWSRAVRAYRFSKSSPCTILHIHIFIKCSPCW